MKWPGHDDISHLVPKIRISEATPLPPYMHSWRGHGQERFQETVKTHYRDVINAPATGLCSGPESYILLPYPFNVLLQSIHLH